MAYPMSHLYVAKHTNEGKLNINNLSQYYLGTLAPDSFHFNDNNNRELKKISHLYNFLDKKNEESFLLEWNNNVIRFFKINYTRESYEFIIGYCIHLITDIYYRKYIWKPFSEKYNVNKNSEYKKVYQEEHLINDYLIYKNEKYEEKIFPLIKRGESIDFCGIIAKDDLEKMKENILEKQYKDKKTTNDSINKIIKYNWIMEHNTKIIDFVEKEFLERI
jgi:hypothetical protein